MLMFTDEYCSLLLPEMKRLAEKKELHAEAFDYNDYNSFEEVNISILLHTCNRIKFSCYTAIQYFL